MKTISIQQQFDILLVAAQVGCSKLEAIAASKGWSFKNLSAEKAEMVKQAVAKITAKRSIKLRAVKGRRPGRKAKTFQRFVGLVLMKANTVDLTAQAREAKVRACAAKAALKGYIKALSVATKATAKVSEVKSKTVGWSESLLKAMSICAQAKAALEAAEACL